MQYYFVSTEGQRSGEITVESINEEFWSYDQLLWKTQVSVDMGKLYILYDFQ